MRVLRVEIEALKGFSNTGSIELSPSINLLVGPNNSGKSTIIRALMSLQRFTLQPSDVRIGSAQAIVRTFLAEPFHPAIQRQFKDKTGMQTDGVPAGTVINQVTTVSQGGAKHNYMYAIPGRSPTQLGLGSLPESEPDNFVYLYLSSRKVTAYDEVVGSAKAVSITGNFSNLYSKIDRLTNPQHRFHNEYRRVCESILGMAIFANPSAGGKRAGIDIDGFRSIDLPAMGDGVAHALGLISDLCVANKKLFLIEEPENDIHPTALKRLMDEIIRKADTNQFVISTHSNIVVKQLGAKSGTRIFSVESGLNDRVPTSSITRVDDTPDARRRVLESLGYELSDNDLWDGWIFFEEASAELFVRQFLIPWFCPTLQGRVRTFSSRTADEVERKVESFRELMTFVHLTPIYDGKTWVIVDGDEKGRAVLAKLKEKFKSWRDDKFYALQETDFENYYPKQFAEEVRDLLKLSHGSEKQRRKADLLRRVADWLASLDVEDAKKAISESAQEPIAILQKIEESIRR
jgi:predicted ATPase